MKFPIATSVLLVFLGTTASAYARQEKGQEEHKQEAQPAQQKDRPVQQQRQPQQHQAQPAAHQQPAARHQTQNAKPVQQQRTEQAAHTQQPQTHAANHTQQTSAGHSQAQVQQTHAAVGSKGGSQHGRISDAHYASSFGSGHSFHVNRGEYDSRRFEYGGYSFGFVDPWPVGWGYSDNVYVVYADGGYYMYDYVHPGLRISINIL